MEGNTNLFVVVVVLFQSVVFHHTQIITCDVLDDLVSLVGGQILELLNIVEARAKAKLGAGSLGALGFQNVVDQQGNVLVNESQAVSLVRIGSNIANLREEEGRTEGCERRDNGVCVWVDEREADLLQV